MQAAPQDSIGVVVLLTWLAVCSAIMIFSEEETDIKDEKWMVVVSNGTPCSKMPGCNINYHISTGLPLAQGKPASLRACFECCALLCTFL